MAGGVAIVSSVMGLATAQTAGTWTYDSCPYVIAGTDNHDFSNDCTKSNSGGMANC